MQKITFRNENGLCYSPVDSREGVELLATPYYVGSEVLPFSSARPVKTIFAPGAPKGEIHMPVDFTGAAYDLLAHIAFTQGLATSAIVRVFIGEDEFGRLDMLTYNFKADSKVCEIYVITEGERLDMDKEVDTEDPGTATK